LSIADTLGFECKVLSGSPKENEKLEFAQDVDGIIVLGGDGTILRIASAAAKSNKPLLAVNLGHLGFLTEIEVKDLENALKKVCKGDYKIEERMMLQVQLIRNKKCVYKNDFLNEAVLGRGDITRLIHFSVYLDGKKVAYHKADGMIVSTPTGSTAYSMAAGGPILQPNSKMVVVTPISAHSLTLSRSLVVSPKTKISLISEEQGKVLLSLDGKEAVTVEFNDEILVTESNKITKLMKLRERSFCDVLYNKLSI
jgi:NAD+ kinase